MTNLPLWIYKHTKQGDLYRVIAIARHTETLEELVVYESLYHSEEFGHTPFWVRPKNMFFEKVIIDGKEFPRFEYIRSS